MKTVAYLTTTHGRPAITLDRARADQYAADTRGLVEELVLRSEAEAALRPWLELQRTVAEMLGLDPATWPDHGNAPLALASTVRLALNGTLRTVPVRPAVPLTPAEIKRESDGAFAAMNAMPDSAVDGGRWDALFARAVERCCAEKWGATLAPIAP